MAFVLFDSQKQFVKSLIIFIMYKNARNKKMLIFAVVLFTILIVVLYFYYYHRWKHLWTMDASTPYYHIISEKKDSLRVAMIGDSWAEIHHMNKMDLYLCTLLEEKSQRPVFMESKGKGGEKTSGIYRLMFYNGEFGTKLLLSSGLDYCIVVAGINDAAANLGARQYCFYYHQIITFLLANHIRPVVVEIPNVNIWHLYRGKPIKDLVVDFIKSIMTRCKMYQFQGYREALYRMLVDDHLLEKVVYVPMKDWNERSPNVDQSLFLSDQIHLNRYGYERLDSCIASYIVKDLMNSSDSCLGN